MSGRHNVKKLARRLENSSHFEPDYDNINAAGAATLTSHSKRNKQQRQAGLQDFRGGKAQVLLTEREAALKVLDDSQRAGALIDKCMAADKTLKKLFDLNDEWYTFMQINGLLSRVVVKA